MSLKISWGCLGICMELLLDLNLTVSSPLLMGTQLAQSLCFSTSLLPNLLGLSLSGSVLEAVSVPPLNLSFWASSSVPLTVCLCLCTLQHPSVCCGCLSLRLVISQQPTSVDFYLSTPMPGLLVGLWGGMPWSPPHPTLSQFSTS